MSEHFRENRAVILFSLAWFILNLIQSYFTEIMEDEAYYWLYSQFPAWGYFDHPPMVAFLIKLGHGIFSNELGSRLFHSLLGAGTVYIIWLLIPERIRDARLYMLTVFAITLMHLNAAGFIALPDTPLVFFTCLYFLVLKRYLVENRLPQAILLGLIVALMMYSKYHALLILFFTIISNWKILTRKSFWGIVAIAVILYLPHILWQIKHDFVSFQYHLVGRNAPFRPRQIFEYLGNQLLVTGPFVGILLLWLSFSHKTRNEYERMLKFNLVGFFGFFLLSSVRGHVEPHWTAAAFPPMIVLAFINLENRAKTRKWLRILSLASIPVILVIRSYLVWDYLPVTPHVHRMFHEKDIWAEQLAEAAGGKPIVFMNKFQYPSVYWYYTGNKAFTRNNILYRRNQFDVWPLEEELEGQSVLFTAYSGDWENQYRVSTVYDETLIFEIDRFCAFNRMGIEILQKDVEAKAGQEFSLPVRIHNPTDSEVNLACDCDIPPLLMSTYFEKDRRYGSYTLEEQPELGIFQPGEELLLDVVLKAPEEPGKYSISVSFGASILLPGINGAAVELEVREGMQ